ncbi:MAG: ribosome biogenesis GTPase YlqF [Arthrospira sp. SH-MAG29]|nr:ribosome biogenesis GTPase YlqF [Arthrospira sp. SH-MAG29]MBS0014933.1 ribosome biogenesis GTPase YlqF [Arthrospira sp. SH-MAG29]
MTIQWYPGHIAKAERTLTEQLKRVDVVLEVRDARIPLATHHPKVSQWVSQKPRLLIINRQDMIPTHIQQQWQQWFEEHQEIPYFTNAQQGDGVDAVVRATKQAGEQLNQKRQQRGMLPRPVRAGVIGFPNVGKSALINRLLGRRVVESARRAGVTRKLQWVRISKQIELLDAPGVIPSRIENQQDALKLAICEDIGEAGYDNQRVAAGMVDLFQHLQIHDKLTDRYSFAIASETGESYLQALADQRFQGDLERTARQLLNDFRKGLLGAIALEIPPS